MKLGRESSSILLQNEGLRGQHQHVRQNTRRLPQAPLVLEGRHEWLRARHKRTNKDKKGKRKGFDEASTKAAQQPATVGIVLGDKPASHGECRVVAASGGGVVDDNGSWGATASGADHPPAVAIHPLRGGVSQARARCDTMPRTATRSTTLGMMGLPAPPAAIARLANSAQRPGPEAQLALA